MYNNINMAFILEFVQKKEGLPTTVSRTVEALLATAKTNY